MVTLFFHSYFIFFVVYKPSCRMYLLQSLAGLFLLLQFLFLHTLFFFQTILWTLSYRNNNLLISWSWSYHISWSYLLIISYLTDSAYFGYYLHALDMCDTWLTPAIHFRCCASHACSMFYLWLMHVHLAAYTAGTGWCFPQKNPFLDMFCDL